MDPRLLEHPVYNAERGWTIMGRTASKDGDKIRIVGPAQPDVRCPTCGHVRRGRRIRLALSYHRFLRECELRDRLSREERVFVHPKWTKRSRIGR